MTSTSLSVYPHFVVCVQFPFHLTDIFTFYLLFLVLKYNYSFTVFISAIEAWSTFLSCSTPTTPSNATFSTFASTGKVLNFIVNLHMSHIGCTNPLLQNSVPLTFVTSG